MYASFTQLPHTCSMFELGGPSLDKYTTKAHFLVKFDDALRSQNQISRHTKSYSIIYNCVSSERYKHLTRIGFTEIGSYMGAHGQKVKVLLFEVNKETKLTFWEWFRS